MYPRVAKIPCVRRIPCVPIERSIQVSLSVTSIHDSLGGKEKCHKLDPFLSLHKWYTVVSAQCVGCLYSAGDKNLHIVLCCESAETKPSQNAGGAAREFFVA